MVIMPLYIQDCRGYSATISGLVMLPGAFGQCIAQFFGGKALDRLGARPVALIGSITLLFGTIMMSLISMTSWIWWVSIWQFVRQIGMGFVLMPITTWSLNCLEPEEVSAGSAVTNTVRQIAGAIGAPVLVILMETFTALRWAAIGGAKNMYAVANVFGIQWALRVSATICFIMVVMVFFGVRGNGAGSTSRHRPARPSIASTPTPPSLTYSPIPAFSPFRRHVLSVVCSSAAIPRSRK